MKLMATLTLLVAIFLASVMVTAIAILSALGPPTPDLRMEDLAAGRLWPMFCGPTFWQLYPSTPLGTEWLLSWPALGVAATILVLIVLLLALLPQMSLAHAAVICLALGGLTYAFGATALQTPRELNEAGAWLGFMLYGLFYPACISIVLALLVLCGVRPPRSRAARPFSILSQLERWLPVRTLPPTHLLPVAGRQPPR